MFHIELTQTPLERGRAHGEQFRKEIHEISSIRRTLIQDYLKDLSLYEIERLAFGQVEKLKPYQALFEEFVGIAQGSNLSLVDLMILNNYTDMRDFGYHPESKQNDQNEEGCSIISLHSSNSQITGQTWDMHASAEPYILNISLKEEGMRTEILTVTGCLALAGANSAGVGVYINNVHCFETNLALFWPGLVREMLKKKSRKDAHECLKNNLPCSGHNYLLVDPSGATNVETTGRRSEVTQETENGVTFHTNHYVGKLKENEILERQSKSTHKRFEVLDHFFKQHPEPTIEQIIEIFQRPVADGGVNIPKSGGEHAARTCGAILFDPKRLAGRIYDDTETRDFRF